jgi:hypothetical protein
MLQLVTLQTIKYLLYKWIPLEDSEGSIVMDGPYILAAGCLLFGAMTIIASFSKMAQQLLIPQ